MFTAKSWWLLVASVATMVVSPFAAGQSMHSTNALTQGAAWADDYAASRVYYYANTPGGDGDVRGSGVLLDPWNVLVSGHEVYSNDFGGAAFNMSIGRGSNYISDPGSIYSVSDAIWHPGWDGSIFTNRVDLAILHLSTPVLDAPYLTFGSASLHDTLIGVGYGKPAANGSWVDEEIWGHQARAFNMFADHFGIGNVSTDYISSSFLPLAFREAPLAGGGTPGNSGSGVWSTSGDLVGLVVGASTGYPSYGYATYSLRTDLYESWIMDNRIVPSPGSLALLGIGGLFAAHRRRRS